MLITDKLLKGMQQVNYSVKQILWANTCNAHTLLTFGYRATTARRRRPSKSRRTGPLPWAESPPTGLFPRLISTILQKPSSRRPDHRERIPVPRSELAKNVNCPAPSRCISSRSGLIGVVPGARRFHKAIDYTPGRLIASTCPF